MTDLDAYFLIHTPNYLRHYKKIKSECLKSNWRKGSKNLKVSVITIGIKQVSINHDSTLIVLDIKVTFN